MKQLFIIFLLTSAALGQSVSGTSGSGAPTGSLNVVPAYAAKGTQTGVGSGATSMSIPAPAGIVNGDALVLVIGVGGANSETWTPPSGFAQLGSTLSAVSGGQKLQSAMFCKVAASESGNYVISWNNGVGAGNASTGNVYRITGATCTTDGVGTATGNVSNLTVTGFATALSNDILVISGQQSETAAAQGKIAVPANVIAQDTGNDFFFGTLTFGFGTTPSIKQTWDQSGTLNVVDTTLQVVALTASTTSTTNSFIAQGQAVNIADMNAIGLNVTGKVGANQIFLPNCGSLNASTPGLFFNNGNNLPTVLICANTAGNLFIDANRVLNQVTIGSGLHGGATLLLGNGSISFITQDASQDEAITTTDVNNNLYYGMFGAADTLSGDDFFNARAGQFMHWGIGTGVYGGDGDIIALGSTGLIGGVPLVSTATPAAPTVTPTCTGTCLSTWGYKLFCKDINGGVTLASSETTTVLQASTLDGTHKNVLTWNPTAGCQKYEVFRSTASTSPATTGIIAEVTTGNASNNTKPWTFTDSGAAGDSTVVPAVNGTGALTARAFISTGTQAVLTGTGACGTFSTQTGGSTAGRATCTAATAASTLTITPGITAPNGWVCYVQDQTTPANLFQQTSTTTTACTLTAASVLQNNVIVFTAIAF